MHYIQATGGWCGEQRIYNVGMEDMYSLAWEGVLKYGINIGDLLYNKYKLIQ